MKKVAHLVNVLQTGWPPGWVRGHLLSGKQIIVVIWMILNFVGVIYHWDPYPFILLNLLFSTQAAYAAPIIMMAQNRQNDKDRIQAQKDYQTNIEAKQEIEQLQKRLNTIEIEKLDKIIQLLQEIKK